MCEPNTIEGVSNKMLKKYVTMRQKVDIEAKTIQSFTNLLALFQLFEDDTIEVEPISLGYSYSLIERSILNIVDLLDDFIYIVEASDILDDLENSDA